MTCPRCQGLMVDNYGDPYCIPCGHRPRPDVGREKTVSEYEWKGKTLQRTAFTRKGGGHGRRDVRTDG